LKAQLTVGSIGYSSAGDLVMIVRHLAGIASFVCERRGPDGGTRLAEPAANAGATGVAASGVPKMGRLGLVLLAP
jgi:hypothetical protein